MKAYFTAASSHSFKVGSPARTRTKNARQNRRMRVNILTLAGIMIIAAAALAVPSYPVHSSSVLKAGPDASSRSTILARWFPILNPPLPQALPAPLATFAADCTTPKTTFVLGDTVCAKATGLIGYRFAWVDSAGFIGKRTAITTDPQTDTFTIPATQTSIVNGTTVDNRGEWRVNAITSRGSLKSSAFFTVKDAQNPAVDLSITKSLFGGNPQEGGVVQFEVIIINNGPDDAANTRFQDYTFSGATYDSVTQTEGLPFICSGSGSADCSITLFPKGSKAKFFVNFTAGPAGGALQNTASVSSDTTEQNSLDNTFTTGIVKVGSGAAPATCVLECPENINANANTEQNSVRGALVTYAAPEATGTCGVVTSSPASGSFFPVGTTTVTATSDTGNGSCSFTVTVIDNTGGPTISCPANKAVNAADSACSATVVPGSPTTTGTGVTVSGERSDGETLAAPYPSGVTTIVWTATDDQDRTVSCSQTITVNTNDGTPPTVTAPVDLTLFTGTDAQTCGLIVGESELGQPTASDNCGDANVSRTGVPSGNFFPLGTTTITYTARDGAGNTSTDTQTVTVTDNTAPAITATEANPVPPPDTVDVPIQDVTVNSDPTSCNAVVSDAALGNVKATDNCGAATLSRTPSGNTFPVGTTTIVWTATDSHGNTGTAMQNVTVVDATPPTITAPADVSAGTGPGRTSCDAADVNLGTASASDNCASTVTHSPEGPYPVGTTTVTWTVTDASGNTATDTQEVTVTDTTGPAFTATAADSSASADATCHALIPDYVSGSAASDNCGGAVTITQSPAAGTSVGVGAQTVTVTATDDAGNSSTDEVVFTVNDTTPPTVTAPNDESYQCASNVPAANAGDATASDNCAGTPTVTVSQSSSGAGSTASPLVITRTYTATDAAGNTASDSQTITVIDTTAPSLTVPAATTVSADNSCHAGIPNVVTGSSASDNCGGSVSVTQSPAAGTSVGLGSHTITVTATDTAGNTTTKTTGFTVNDTTAPVISCPANIVVTLPANTSATSMAVSFPAPTATDNCSTPGVVTSVASGSVFPMGTTTVTATATDAAGNSSTCTFTVTVLYNFTGFFSPVSNTPTLNTVNAGRAIPVKFSLSGNKGLNIFAVDSPYSVSLNCASNDPGVDVIETLNAGGSSLSYGGDQYNYVWKTENSWAGTCRQLVVKLNDGSTHVANFKFR